MDKLRKEVKKRKENESTLQTDLEDIKEEMGQFIVFGFIQQLKLLEANHGAEILKAKKC